MARWRSEGDCGQVGPGLEDLEWRIDVIWYEPLPMAILKEGETFVEGQEETQCVCAMYIQILRMDVDTLKLK